MTRSFGQLLAVDLGFSTIGVQTFTLTLPSARYTEPEQRAAFVYIAHAQFPVEFVTVVARGRDEPSALVAPMRAALRELDPDVPMFRIFEVAPTDPATYVLVALSLLTVALIASWIPARRAARIDPVTALRQD